MPAGAGPAGAYAKDRLRLLPPLTLTEYDVERALSMLGDALSACGAAPVRREDPA